MKNNKKLSLSLLIVAGISTTQTHETRRNVNTVGSAVTEAPAGVLDYTVLLPATASRQGDDTKDNERSAGQTVLVPVATAVDAVPDILTFGHSKQLKTEFNDGNDDTKKSQKKKSSSNKKSCKKNSQNESYSDNDNMESMTSDNAESLL